MFFCRLFPVCDGRRNVPLAVCGRLPAVLLHHNGRRRRPDPRPHNTCRIPARLQRCLLNPLQTQLPLQKNATAVFFMFRFIEVPPFFLYHKYNTVRRLNPVGAGMSAVQFCSSI